MGFTHDELAGFLPVGTVALRTANKMRIWKLRFKLKRGSGVVVKYSFKVLGDHLPSF